MKQAIRLTALCICLLAAGMAGAKEKAEKTPVQHGLAVTAHLNYATLLRSTKEATRLDVNPWLGSAPGIGAAYHLTKGHFTFDLGGELEYGVYTNRSGSAIIIGATTIPGGTIEMIQNLNVNIPFMFGGEFGKFYFKVGAGPSFCVYGLGARTESGSKQYKVSRMPQLRCRAEIGGEVGASKNGMARYQLGAYADYGVLNERPIQRKGSYADGVPYHIADESTADILHNLSVGVRFTCLLDFTKK